MASDLRGDRRQRRAATPLRQRRTCGRDALPASHDLLGGEGSRAPIAAILVELDERDTPTEARSELILHGRRKQLRHVARRAIKAVKTVENLALSQAPEAEKKDPAILIVTTALDPKEPIEELVSHSMRLLDTLVVELAARRD